MVLMNATKRARYTSSIINQNSGGGPSKAGLLPTVGVSSWERIAYNTRGLPLSLTVMSRTLLSRPPSENRPVGFRYMRMR